MVADGLASRGRGAGGEGRRGVGRGLPGALARVAALVLLALCAVLAAPTAVSADDARDAGITVNLHDYTADTVNYEAGGRPWEQTMHALRFGDGDKTNDSVNRWTNSEAVLSGILQDTLVNGYPALSTGWLSDSQLDGESLAYLFNPQDTSQSGVTHHADVSGLLRQDADGYWYYSANDNYAYFNGSSFQLYDYPRFNIDQVNNGNDLTGDRGQFMPFNRLSDSQSVQGNGKLGYSLEGEANYHFGIDVSTDFIYPCDGQVNGQDMVFEFAGDDDVWVFIDGTLVLDLGGIHNSATGTINFATGDVTVNGSVVDNLANLLGEGWDTAYQEHTMNFYYLERGEGSSNMSIRFNLPTIPSGTINVGKSVDYSNVNDVSDIDFTFNAYVNADGAGEDFQLYTGSYGVYDMDTNALLETRTATDGAIVLKDGQYARLSDGITEASTYYLVEVGATSDKYEVDITNADIEVTQGDGSSSTQSGATTDVISVADNAYVVFGNSIVANNAFNLRVQKTGSVPEGETFYARVQVGSLDYVGEYTVYDASGSEVRTASTSNGVIELKTGQYAEIVELAGGNTVSVYEVTSSGDAFLGQNGYQNPSYSMAGNALASGATQVTDGSGNVVGVSGTAAEGKELGSQPLITATIENALTTGSLSVSKEVTADEGLTAPSGTFEFEVHIDGLDGSVPYTLAFADGTSSEQWAQFTNVEPGLYLVRVVPEDAGVVYQTTIMKVAPVAQDDGTWGAATGEVALKKGTDNIETSLDKKVQAEDGSWVESVNTLDAEDTAHFRVSVAIPEYNGLTESSGVTFTLTDTLPDGLTYESASTEGDLGTVTVSPDQKTVTVVLDAQDLIDAAEAGTGTLTLYVDATVDPGQTGELTNSAYVTWYKHASDEDPVDTDEDTASVVVYGAKVTKTEGSLVDGIVVADEGSTLDGAEFKLQKLVGRSWADVATGLAANPTTDVVSSLGAGTYRWVETKAPAGYQLNERGLEFTVGSSGKVESVNAQYYGDLKDDSILSLPETGEGGTLALSVAGAALVAIGVGWVLRARSRRGEEA